MNLKLIGKNYNKKNNGVRVVRRITGLFTLRRLTAARPPQWLGHSATLHSHAVAPAHFASPGLCFAKPLSGLAKRRKQPDVMRNFFEIF
jgi:hypothetical protein